VFSEGGFIAGLSYILIFLILLRDSYYLHKNRTEEDGIIHSLLFATVMGFGFISLVDFPMERFSHNIIFFVLAAIIIASRLKQQGFSNEKLPRWATYLFLFITCFAAYVASIRYTGEIHSTNAIHYKSKGNWNYVIKAIDKAYNPFYYEMENTSTPLLWYRGVAYFNQQKYDLALKDFKDAYKVNPYHLHVLNNLATSYQMRGDSEKAKKFYRDVFKVNPTFKETRINLAAILYNEKKYVQALDVILQSKVDPYWKRKKNNDNYDLYLKTIVNSWINSVYINANNEQKKALNAWRKSFDQPLYLLGAPAEKAKEFYVKVFDVCPTFKETRVNLAAILYNEKKYVEALDVILQSKVDPYWKRKRNNDNYDLYLKTIVNSWINSVYVNANNEQKKALNAWELNFDKKPQYSASKTVDLFKIRQKEDVDYLSALILYEEGLR